MLDPADSRMLIRGGMLFAEGSEAKLSEATFGGSLVKMGWIGHGMRMELYIKQRRFCCPSLSVTTASSGLVGSRLAIGDAFVPHERPFSFWARHTKARCRRPNLRLGSGGERIE